MVDEVGSRFAASLQPPVLTLNRTGSSPFVILCDHASNRIPTRFGTLGLDLHERLMHIAWDPGALGVSKQLSRDLDAPLVHATTSRLVIDPNRAPDAPDLIPEISEVTRIPGNENLKATERSHRIAEYHAPFHAGIRRLLDEREARGLTTVIVCMHSFTPVYRGVRRPWPVGVIPGATATFSEAVFEALGAEDEDIRVGWNEPYSANTNVTYTLDTHCNDRGLTGVMIEIRNDEILEPPGVALWAGRMARCLEVALKESVPDASANLPKISGPDIRRDI